MAEEGKQNTQDRVLVELTIAAPADTVWQALREPARIATWFGWDADTLPAEIDEIFLQYARASDAERVLRFDGMDDRIEVLPGPQGTLLRLVRAAPAGDDWDDVYEDMTEGWISFFHQLRLALERHPTDRRRTLYFSGAARQPGLAPTAALGLPSPREAQAQGALVASTAPAAPAMQAWHRSSHQLGLLVPEWGQGLLVVLDKPASATFAGGGSITLTTYGLDEARFTALESAWQGWWAERFAPSGTASCG
jgi:hypothetical protein